MASREQLHILSKGVLHWNKWREEHPDENIDLSYIDIAAEISERRLRLSFTSALFIPSITKAIQTLIIINTFFYFPNTRYFLFVSFSIYYIIRWTTTKYSASIILKSLFPLMSRKVNLQEINFHSANLS